jgi:hypothetical protein
LEVLAVDIATSTSLAPLAGLDSPKVMADWPALVCAQFQISGLFAEETVLLHMKFVPFDARK